MEKGKYVDGFVIVVPKKNAAAYKKMARMGAKMWKDFGALDYKECKGDNLKPNMGGAPSRDFKKLTGAKPTDDVWFSFVVYKSKKQRDAINKKVMKAMPEMPKMPFDMRKFSYGGFKVEVD